MDKSNLQVENGNFTRIVNPLIEELIKVPFKGCELAVAMFIIRKTYGHQKTQDPISLSTFERELERGRPTINKALKNLQLVNVVTLVKKGNIKGASNIWAINKYCDTWKLVNVAKLVKAKHRPSETVYTKPSEGGLTHKRKKERIKEIAETSSTPFNLEKYLKAMEEHKSRHIQVIAFYFRKKNLKFNNLSEIQSAIRRHLRAAKEVANFDDDKIVSAYRQADKEYPSIYTVETLHKILTR